MKAFNITVIHEKDPMIVAKAQDELTERMDPGFWNPRWENIYRKLKESGAEIRSLGDFIKDSEFTSGYRGAIKFVEKGVIALKVRNIMNTGLDITNADFVSLDSPANAPPKRVRKNDLLLIRSGVGSIGRNTLITSAIDACITGHIYRVPITDLCPAFVSIFLKTKYGLMQLERHWSGVSGQVEIDREDVKKVLIPVLPKRMQQDVEQQYLQLGKYHDIAMDAKAKMLGAQKHGNIAAAEKYRIEYEHNLRIAEAMLNDLIRQVEEIIEGKRTEIEPVDRILKES